MPIYFITQRRALINKLADIIDRAEGYHADVRRPGYVTERHANTDVHPLGNSYAYIFDNTIWKHRAAILDELDKYGVAKATIANKAQRIRDALSVDETVTFSSGVLSGVTLQFVDKDATWQPPANELQAKAK